MPVTVKTPVVLNLTSADIVQGHRYPPATIQTRSDRCYVRDLIDISKVAVGDTITVEYTVTNPAIKTVTMLCNGNTIYTERDDIDSPCVLTKANTNAVSMAVTFRTSDNQTIYPSNIPTVTIRFEVSDIFYWQKKEDDYPKIIDCVTPPDIPNTNIHMWRITEGVNGGYPYTGMMPQMPHLGAFANAKKLKYVRIPPSVKRIGEYSFINTQLKSVTIAKDCVYSNTSFPEGCTVNFYP